MCVRGGQGAGNKGRNEGYDTSAGAAGRRRAISGDPLGPNSEIGRKLKQYYDELVSDQVPDRFSQLLSQLEQADPARKKD
ncbi:MAG: hypothetical protein E5W25_16125 [Mesorhizobium sp.]|nr:MAG: hypothetical protein E5W25_16125 [Mesorhizobium sp.]